jgi:prepilin-type N-terminal cleavage/methylation domain-containing protein
MAKSSLGFTLIELLVSLAVLAVIVGFIVVAFQNYANFQRFNTASSLLKTTLLNTRADARNSVSGQPHGVKIDTNSITTFIGSTYSAVDPNNQVISFNEVTLTTDLSAGTDEIIFAQLSGLPSATGTITIVGSAYAATSTATVTASGVIQ